MARIKKTKTTSSSVKNIQSKKVSNVKADAKTTELKKITKLEPVQNQQAYSDLLSDVQKQIKQTQDQIVKSVTRQKVVMAWNLGKIIDTHLSRSATSGYGEQLLKQLTNDVSISKTVLYEMRNFYKTYHELPKDDDRLNWGHYRKLIGIKKVDERKYLEDLTRQNGWDNDQLHEEVKKSQNTEEENPKTKNGNGKFAKKDASGNVIQKNPTNKKLRPERGHLFSYPLIKLEDTGKTYIDCGFNFFREVEEGLTNSVKKSAAVDVTKIDSKQKGKISSNYELKKSETHPRKFNTYKAFIERVVDGDTIRFTIDLGFKSFYKEIIRLKGVNAPESNTDEGKKSSKFLTNLLKNVPFVVIKTIKIDIYGRYVADVFLPKNNTKPQAKSVKKPATGIDPQQVANEGIYLNQLLLDKGLVKILDE